MPPVARSADPEQFARNVATTLFAWDTTTGLLSLDYTSAIVAVGDPASAGPVKGLTLSPGLALLEVEGAGMIGVPGTAQRVFEALRMADVSVVMISQGSSEHSICCVLRAAEAERAQTAVSTAFANELARGQIHTPVQAGGMAREGEVCARAKPARSGWKRACCVRHLKAIFLPKSCGVRRSNSVMAWAMAGLTD